MYYGKYRRTNEEYPVMEALQIAVAVDRKQGFVSAKQTHYDPDTGTYVRDNRTLVLNNLRHAAGKAQNVEDIDERLVEVTDQDRIDAVEIFNHFDQVLLMDKMADDLVKIGKDGRRNDFNQEMARIFDSGQTDANKELAMIVSLPNSRRIANKREMMDEFYATHKANGFIGNMKQRMDLTAKVMDVKYIPRHSLHLVTIVTENGQIGKFFLNENLAEVAKRIDGQNITFKGTVKKQDTNDFTGCQETVFNRVKIEE